MSYSADEIRERVRAAALSARERRNFPARIQTTGAGKKFFLVNAASVNRAPKLTSN